MADLLAWVGNHLVGVGEARVSVFDRGFRSGEGVFETLRGYSAHPFRLGRHLDRAAQGASLLGFDLPPRSLLTEAVTATARANFPDRDCALRLTVSAGRVDPASSFPGDPVAEPMVVVTAQPLRVDPSLYARGIGAVSVPWSRELPQVKAVSHLAAALARQRATAKGAQEALLTAGGLVLEGSYSNVFAVRHGRVVTPPVDGGILPGVTRAVTLEVAATQGVAVEERALTLEELLEAEEAFVTASTRELVPLVRVDGRPVGEGVPGPLTRALHEGYRAEVRREVRWTAQHAST